MSALAAHYTPEHQMFRETCRRFFEKEVTPFHMKWEEDGIVPRELWRKAGEQGLLGMTMPEAYGGTGADFLYSAILIEEQGRALASGPAFSLHNDIVVPYLLHYGTEEQKKKWIPKAVAGELITAIAMTEPGTGSDLHAQVCWMHQRPLQRGKKYYLKHTSNTVQAMVTEIDHRIDMSTLEPQPAPSELVLNDIGEIRIRTAKPLVYDGYATNRLTGSFILIEQGTNATVAAGMLLPSEQLVQPESGDYMI